MNQLLLGSVVAALVKISQKASTIIRNVKISGELGVKEKAKEDYVTVADFNSQMCIVKSIENLFPKIKLCGEEGDLKGEFKDIETTLDEEAFGLVKNLGVICPQYNKIKEEDLFIWVDPLDGTREFATGDNHVQEVTILIGVSYKGKPIAGVINQPFFTRNIHDLKGDRTLWGIVGFGAFQNGNQKRVFERIVAPKENLSDRIRLITSRSHMTPVIQECLNNIKNCEIRNSGGCGYKTLSVIEGYSDCYLYPREGTKRWDTCAPEAILRSIGGELTDIFNKPYDYGNMNKYENSRGLLATLNQHHSYILSCITQQVIDQVLDTDQKINSQK